MLGSDRVLCVIPARAGSKGLPGKNLLALGGRPLLAHSIEHALASRYVDRVVVSTDGEDIAEAARAHGADVPFMRPAELAGDDAGTVDVLLHALDWLEEHEGDRYGVLLLLHVTTPLRAVADVDGCLELLAEADATNVFSVTEAHRNPYFNMVELGADGAPRLVKEADHATRQAAPPVYDMNSSIYAWRVPALRRRPGLFLERTRAYFMPKHRSVDIDDGLDYLLAQAVWEQAPQTEGEGGPLPGPTGGPPP